MSHLPSLKIELKAEEEALLAETELNVRAVTHGEPARQNGQNAAKLAAMLLDRDAIPDVREAVFTDNEYAIGRGPSPLTNFRRRGLSTEEMLRHPHFLAWLRYFIFGPNLPEALLAELRAKIDEFGDVTSGDYEELRHFIRPLVKRFNLTKMQTDEIFKAALEFDLELDLTDTLRREARKVAKTY